MIELGQTLMLLPSVKEDRFNKGVNNSRKLPGTVIYINRRHRYYTVKFKAAGGEFCESFKLKDGE